MKFINFQTTSDYWLKYNKLIFWTLLGLVVAFSVWNLWTQVIKPVRITNQPAEIDFGLDQKTRNKVRDILEERGSREINVEVRDIFK